MLSSYIRSVNMNLNWIQNANILALDLIHVPTEIRTADRRRLDCESRALPFLPMWRVNAIFRPTNKLNVNYQIQNQLLEPTFKFIVNHQKFTVNYEIVWWFGLILKTIYNENIAICEDLRTQWIVRGFRVIFYRFRIAFWTKSCSTMRT